MMESKKIQNVRTCCYSLVWWQITYNKGSHICMLKRISALSALTPKHIVCFSSIDSCFSQNNGLKLIDDFRNGSEFHINMQTCAFFFFFLHFIIIFFYTLKGSWLCLNNHRYQLTSIYFVTMSTCLWWKASVFKTNIIKYFYTNLVLNL